MARTREDEIRSRLDDIAGPDPGEAERALLARLLRSFTAKTPARVDRLGELLHGGDRAAVRDHAHGLKGSAANIGATVLAAMFAEVEHSAREGVVPDPDVTLARIGAEQAIVLGSVATVAGELGEGAQDARDGQHRLDDLDDPGVVVQAVQQVTSGISDARRRG